MKIIKINDLDFYCTCYSCPEQYEVKKNGNFVAYVRLRFGELTCADYKEKIIGETFYEFWFDEDFKGDFSNENERLFYLNEIAIAINEYLKK